MQCQRCSLASSAAVAVAESAIEAADRRSQLVCAVCGGPLVPRGSMVDRVAARLARFASFGLTADASPLLELHRSRGANL